MKVTLVLLCLMSSVGMVSAQTATPDKATGLAPQSTGRTAPETKGQLQPQGWTGPIETTTGGAPAESPQGQSPPGMQAAPEGSSKTVVEPEK
jgi:hypothetical protein